MNRRVTITDMLTIFSHAGHDHSMEMNSGIDHCMPIIIGAGIIIAILLGIIAYLLVNRQPQTPAKNSSKSDKK